VRRNMRRLRRSHLRRNHRRRLARAARMRRRHLRRRQSHLLRRCLKSRDLKKARRIFLIFIPLEHRRTQILKPPRSGFRPRIDRYMRRMRYLRALGSGVRDASAPAHAGTLDLALVPLGMVQEAAHSPVGHARQAFANPLLLVGSRGLATEEATEPAPSHAAPQ